MTGYTADARRMLTDHDIVDACSASRVRAAEAAGHRLYSAVYEGEVGRIFAVGHARAARVYASEYGIRILNKRLIDVRWLR